MAVKSLSNPAPVEVSVSTVGQVIPTWVWSLVSVGAKIVCFEGKLCFCGRATNHFNSYGWVRYILYLHRLTHFNTSVTLTLHAHISHSTAHHRKPTQLMCLVCSLSAL